MAFTEFLCNNPLFVILGILGLLCVIITYAALIVSHRKGRYVSGCPAVGGILIMLAFLTTDYKWLALLGFLDYGIVYFVFGGLIGLMKKRRNKST